MNRFQLKADKTVTVSDHERFSESPFSWTSA